MTEAVEITPVIPAPLQSAKDALSGWLPIERKLRFGAQYGAATKYPRLPLTQAWPRFALWLLTDDLIGAKQNLPANKRFREITTEIESLLDKQARGEDVPDERMEELAYLTLPYAEKLVEEKNPAAGAAWQAYFHIAMGDPRDAMEWITRGNLALNPDRATIIACMNLMSKKLLEILRNGH